MHSHLTELIQKTLSSKLGDVLAKLERRSLDVKAPHISATGPKVRAPFPVSSLALPLLSLWLPP